MRDIDFAGFVDEARQAFKPQYNDVVRRASHRRTRRVYSAVAAVAAASAGIVGVGTLLPGHILPSLTTGAATPGAPTPNSPPGPLATAGPTPGYLPVPGPSVSSASVFTNYKVRTMTAGDLDHQYFVTGACQDPGHCAYTFMATENRGATWHVRTFPAPAGDTFFGLTTLGPQTVVANFWNSGPVYLVSTDAGRTWRKVVAHSVAHAPDGWRALPCPPDAGAGCTPVMGDPATGDLARLDSPYGLIFSPLGLGSGVQVAGGVWVYQHWNGQPPQLAVTHDGGRSWLRSTMPYPVVAVAASADGRTGYALLADAKQVLVYRSTDGGRTWHATGAVLAGAAAANVRPDGALIVQTGGAAAGQPRPARYESTDGGRTLHQIPLGPGALAVPVTGGYAQTAYDGGEWLSTDLVGWAYVKAPK